MEIYHVHLQMLTDNYDGAMSFFLKGFALKNMDYAYVKRLIWILQHCYPERLGVCLIVNSPWIFYGCWSIIKLWLVNLELIMVNVSL